MSIKMNEMWDSVFKELERWAPNVYDNAVDWYPSGRFEITIKTNDEQKYIFDWINKQIYLIVTEKNEKPLSVEEEWRIDFGRNLRKRMWYSGVSLEELSKLTGISQNSLSMYLNGKRTPSTYNLSVIARVLECGTEELVYF